MKRFLTSVLVFGFCYLPTPGSASSPKLKKQLAAQNFSGVLEGDVRFIPLGTVNCGTKPFHVIFYEWYEPSPAGKAVHASYRIILMDGDIYVGSYVVEDKPTIQGNLIRFPYSDNGNSIGCEANSAAPQKVLLGGEFVLLEK